MRKNNEDERVVAQKRKIGSDAFNILFVGLLLSILVQQRLFDAPLSQYLVEVILFLSISVYILVRNLLIGNDLFSSKKKGQTIIIINSLVCGATVSVITTIQNYLNYSDNIKSSTPVHIAAVATVTFISASLVTFIVLKIMYTANKKKQDAIDRKLDSDE